MLRYILQTSLFFTIFILSGCKESVGANSYEETSNISISENKTVLNHTNRYLKEDVDKLKVIDLLVLVDENDKDNFNGINETKIDHFIAVSNKVYKNSGLNIKLNIKKIEKYDFQTVSSEDTLSFAKNSSAIKRLKNENRADLVLIYRKYANDGYCGIAYVNSMLREDLGYAHVSFECIATTTAHEIGHTMGLRHSLKNTKKRGVFDYARGYGVEGEFVTVMGYRSIFGAKSVMYNFSSPNLECKGYECGVDSELNDGADAVKALRYSSSIVSKFR
jgi:hypothetical protein